MVVELKNGYRIEVAPSVPGSLGAREGDFRLQLTGPKDEPDHVCVYLGADELGRLAKTIIAALADRGARS